MRNYFLSCIVVLILVSAASAQKQAQTTQDAALFTNGYSSFLEGKYKEALDIFGDFGKKYPNSIYMDRVFFWKAWCHTELKNYGKSIKLFEELIEKYPASSYTDDALFKIGDIYENYLHDYDKAVEVYERLIKLFPSAETAIYSNASNNIISAQQQKAQIEERNLNMQQALNDWKESQMLIKKYNPSSQNDNYLNKKAQDKINFIKNHSDNDWLPLTRFTEAQILSKEGKCDLAIKKFQEILNDFPKSSLADNSAYEITLCLKKQNDNEGAKESLKKFIKDYPKSELVPEARRLLQ